jgi:dipeptidyl aminopeptidase/acylaminoacyl peptidase
MKKSSFIISLFILLVGFSSCNRNIKPDETKKEKPTIFPDYSDVTIPYNIAPLNFRIEEKADGIAVTFKGKSGGSIFIKGKTAIEIPGKKWTTLLEANKGGEITATVTVKKDNKWISYAPFSVFVSNDPVDYGLAYRLIAPGYEVYSKMGIYQRELSTFDQDAVLENTLLTGSCVNCHSFRLANPDDMSLHIRGKNGGTVLTTGGEVKLLNTKTPKTISNFVYPFWHPGGNYIAYSVNKTKQVFHETKAKRVEVIDAASDVVVYDVINNQTLYCDKLMTQNKFETFPAFSVDGRTLYFCAADARQMPMEYTEVHYNLYSIGFNPETGTFENKIDTVFNASEIGKSVTFPRPSPDGQYLMFTLVDYGNFSIWHKEADLYLLDFGTGETRSLEAANSNDTESYHSWSSNSRWFVFSSRRLNGLYTRPFIAHIDENGNSSKPFLLPQKNPDHYDNLLFSFNIPEFINKKVKLNIREVEKLAYTSGTNVAQRE